MAAHLDGIRTVMKAEGIDLWYDAGTDPHLGEYIPDRWQTRAWLTGFTGSAGTVVITQDFAGLWTDSRYFIQAERQLKGSGVELFRIGVPGTPSPEIWIEANLPEGSVFGFNGACLSAARVLEWQRVYSSKKYIYKSDFDIIDAEWDGRPGLPENPVFIHDLKYAGEGADEKLERIRAAMDAAGTDGLFLTLLDEIAWTLNLRGSDIAYNPVAVAYLWIGLKDAVLFMETVKIDDTVRRHLDSCGVRTESYYEAEEALRKLAAGSLAAVDNNRISWMHYSLIKLKAKSVKKIFSFPYDFKSIKNPVEQEGIRNAHIRDGVAMVRWMMELEAKTGREKMTEVSVADDLEEIRSRGNLFKGLSFTTIAGYKGNGAIVHYSARPETAAEIYADGLLLLDSGGQYLDGTTDITRTIALSEPTAEECLHYTLVLKGHVRLAMAKFPKGTTGANLDILAREALWQHGLDYGHGTGHGVGCFLNVHEGPQRISLKGGVPIRPGMLISNEPGLYFENRHGIRIENLILCRESGTENFYEFETVTICPLDLRLIEAELLLPDEKEWINAYHRKVYDLLKPELNTEEKRWLEKATRPLV